MKRRVSGFLLIFLLCCSCLVMFLGVNAETSLQEQFGGFNNWSVVKGAWSISNGILTGSASTNDWALIHGGDTSWTNYQVTVNMSILNSNDEACLVVRYTDSVNFYWIDLGVLSHKYSIGRVANDVYTELAYSGLSSELQAGRPYAVTVLAVSGLLKMYVDRVKVLEINDSTLPNGGVGFRTYDGTMKAQQMIVQTFEWSQTYGGTNTDYAYSVVQTIDGGYALTGSTNSFSEVANIWLVKTDGSGNQLWSKTFGGIASDSATSMIHTSDGGYALAGSTSSFGAGSSDF